MAQALTLKLDNFKQLFPKQQNHHDMKTRQTDKYHVNMSNGKRYAVSAIPSTQKLLNKERKKAQNQFYVTNKLCLYGSIVEPIKPINY